MQSYGYCSKDVADVIGADEVGMHVSVGPLEVYKGVARCYPAYSTAVGDDMLKVPLLRHSDKVLVVGIEEDRSVAQKVVEFALGFHHAFERAEALQVGTTDVGNESAGGFDGLYERLDVARVAGTHLDDGYLVLLGQAEQCLGHTHVVVEVTLGVEHVVLLAQNGGDEFLGGRLAVGAGDADNWDIELAAVLACQVLKGLQTVLDYDYFWIGWRYILINNGVGTAFLQRLNRKLVTIERLALQSEKDATLGALAAVGGDYRVFLV